MSSHDIILPDIPMLVTNEVLSVASAGRAGVIAEVLDLAAMGTLRVTIGSTALKANDRFSLEYMVKSDPTLSEPQTALLETLFSQKPDTGTQVTLAELESKQEEILPAIDALQTHIRKSLAYGRGPDRFYGMDPKRYEQLRTPAKIVGALGVLGFCIATHKYAHYELPIIPLNGWLASGVLAGGTALGIRSEMQEKVGIQMRAVMLLSPLEATRSEMLERHSNSQLGRPNASERDYHSNAQLQQQYQRALALSVLLKISGYWLQHISRINDGKHPTWMSPSIEPTHTFESDAREFIIAFSDILDTPIA